MWVFFQISLVPHSQLKLVQTPLPNLFQNPVQFQINYSSSSISILNLILILSLVLCKFQFSRFRTSTQSGVSITIEELFNFVMSLPEEYNKRSTGYDPKIPCFEFVFFKFLHFNHFILIVSNMGETRICSLSSSSKSFWKNIPNSGKIF